MRPRSRQTYLDGGRLDERMSISAKFPAALLRGTHHALLHRRKTSAMLELEARGHDFHALVHLAEPVAVGNPHAIVVADVRALVHEGVDGLDLDTLRLEGHDEHREPLMFRELGIRADKQQHIVGEVRPAGEHLLSIDAPEIAVPRGPRSRREYIRPCSGLGVSEAAKHLSRCDL